MRTVPVSADRRFHRAHVKPARRRGPMRHAVMFVAKVVVPLGLVVVLGYQGASAIGTSSTFQIQTVKVSGNTRTPTADIMAALNGLQGTSIVTVDLDAWRLRLQETPWVRDATFHRALPSTLEIAVTEREPVGIGRIKNRLYVIDERGAVIADYGPQYADLDLPIIDGLSASPGRDGQGDEGRAALAARVIAALRAQPAIAQRLSQVDVADPHNAAVIVNGDPAVIYVGEDRFLPRLESYLGLATTLRERVADIDYVDLRFDDRIYVRPSSMMRGKKVSAPVPGARVDVLPAKTALEPQARSARPARTRR